MAITETTYRPTVHSTTNKNTKAELAAAIVRVWDKVQDCKDEKTKEEIIKALLYVL